jgi:cytoskeleton protein RodZ
MDGEIGHDRVSGVGSALRACRLRHGIPLADVARALRIRQSFLAAIEDGRFSELPGATYTLGFVRAYAEFLALDGDEVIRRLRAEEHQAPPPRELHFPTPSNETGSPRGGILLVGALIAALAYGGWYVLSSQDEPLVSQLTDPIPEQLSALMSGAPTDDQADRSQTGAPDPALAPDSGPAAEIERGDAPSMQDEPTAAVAGTASGRSADVGPGGRRRTDDAVAPAQAATRPDDAATRPVPSERPSVAASASLAPPADDPTTHATRASVDADSTAASPKSPVSGAAGGVGGGAAPAEASADAAARPAGSDVAAVVDAPNHIVIRATEASWIEIRDRRGRRLAGRLMQPGEMMDVPGQTGMRMTVGNAGGVLLVVDGRALPPLGESGVVRRGVSLDPEDLRTIAAP